ncbi:CvpA family protein [Sphaerotilus sp.]|jgi:membrane protein required for colicin V production|uniref:CvpA family protein n=1 Tax=Sphaerotilus sp. TaxID=2093942 RepID=UPI0025D95228|nr:CvpA family protein [Sphaerotilus sp.]
MLADLGWIDLAMLAVLALSVVAGMLRGLVSEVMSLGGWVVAWLLSQAWALDVAAALHIGEPGGQIARLSGLVITFVATLLAWRVLTWLLQQVIHATPLAPLDRLLGAAFGVLRGGLILLVAVMMLGLTPMARQPSWQASDGVRWLTAAQAVLAPWLPGDWRPLPSAAPEPEPSPSAPG